MTSIFKRILDKKKEVKLGWDQITKMAGIKQSSWMTGVPTVEPTDEELKKLAPVLKTTFEWLKYGKK